MEEERVSSSTLSETPMLCSSKILMDKGHQSWPSMRLSNKISLRSRLGKWMRWQPRSLTYPKKTSQGKKKVSKTKWKSKVSNQLILWNSNYLSLSPLKCHTLKRELLSGNTWSQHTQITSCMALLSSRTVAHATCILTSSQLISWTKMLMTIKKLNPNKWVFKKSFLSHGLLSTHTLHTRQPVQQITRLQYSTLHNSCH